MIGLRALLVLGMMILRSVRGRVEVKEKHAWVGSDVVLKCSVDIQDSAVTQVTWRRKENGQNVDFLTYDESSGVQKLTQFAEERVELLGNGHAGESIEVRDVSLTDESVYTCIFTTFPSGEYQNVIHLIVQAEPDIHMEPPPDPKMAESPYQTVAICVAGAAKPAAKITWQTGGLDFVCSERETQHDNGTVTTESQLRMIPGPGIKDRSVTCIISQEDGLFVTQTERELTIRNVQYPPDSVQVDVRTLDNGTVQFICEEDSSPPATNFIWKRKDTYDSDEAVELGNGKTLSGENFQNGLYICDVTNLIGKSSASLYFYKAPGSSCLCDYMWPFLILFLIFLILGVILLAVGKATHKKKEELEWSLTAKEQNLRASKELDPDDLKTFKRM